MTGSRVFYFGTFGSDTTSLSVFRARACTSSNSLQAQPVCVVTHVSLQPFILVCWQGPWQGSVARTLSFCAFVFSLREDPCTGVIHPSRGVHLNDFLDVSEPCWHVLLTQKHTNANCGIKYCDTSLLLKIMVTSNTGIKCKQLQEKIFYRFFFLNILWCKMHEWFLLQGHGFTLIPSYFSAGTARRQTAFPSGSKTWFFRVLINPRVTKDLVILSVHWQGNN